jgi:hypothetical protein
MTFLRGAIQRCLQNNMWINISFTERVLDLGQLFLGAFFLNLVCTNYIELVFIFIFGANILLRNVLHKNHRKG